MVLAKKYRLYAKDDFSRMRLKSSGRAFWKYGTVIYRKNNMLHSRFAFVVSGRVSKRSTVRNLLKRRISEWVRKNVQNGETGHDVVFIFSKHAVETKPAIFFQDLERLLQSIGIVSRL